MFSRCKYKSNYLLNSMFVIFSRGKSRSDISIEVPIYHIMIKTNTLDATKFG
jgi:hypothetical protein